MEENFVPNLRRWEDMDTDILVKIFQSFDIFELISGFAHVCRGWRFAVCDTILWKKLDLSMMKSNFIKIPLEPSYVYVDAPSDKLLTKVLKISLNLSKGCISTLIFHFDLYISDNQLTYTAERTPNLKRLVMPAWNRIKHTGICKAISMWPQLESLTMPTISSPPYPMEQIARSCKNFTQLKIMGPFDIYFASTLVSFLPNLKVLSIRCSTIWRDALIMILNEMKNLEVLNISHCLLLEKPPPAPKTYAKKLDGLIMEKAARLKEFLFCIDDSCVMCQRVRQDEGLVRWYKYEEGLWKTDEVKSFAILSG